MIEKVLAVQVQNASFNRERCSMSSTLQLKEILILGVWETTTWHCCLTHKTLKCIYDDLTGRLGGSAWVCIWERGRIWPLTQSNKCCCIYSLADSLMFFSQRGSIFFLGEAEEEGGQCFPLAVQGETKWPAVRTGRRQWKMPFRSAEGSGPLHHRLLFL